MSERGFGIKLEYTTDGGSTWVEVGEVVDGTPLSITKDTYETTHHGTAAGHKTFEGGLVDFGEATLVVNYDPTDVGHALMRTRAATAHESAQQYQFTYGDTGATVETFTAICTGFEPAVPIDDKITATITFKASGGATQA